jgi:ArsR family transcriptional regulator
MDTYASIFKVLSDDTRLRIVHLLLASGLELCCCELTDALEVPQYNISRHLKALKDAGLVSERREGKWVYYSVVSDADPFQAKLLEAVASIGPRPAFEKDERELGERLARREGGRCVLGTLKTHLLSGPPRAHRARSRPARPTGAKWSAP